MRTDIFLQSFISHSMQRTLEAYNCYCYQRGWVFIIVLDTSDNLWVPSWHLPIVRYYLEMLETETDGNIHKWCSQNFGDFGPLNFPPPCAFQAGHTLPYNVSFLCLLHWSVRRRHIWMIPTGKSFTMAFCSNFHQLLLGLVSDNRWDTQCQK